MNFTSRTTNPALISCFSVALGFLISGTLVHGQTPDKTVPVSWRSFKTPPAPVLSPEQALKSFKLPPGFQIELVAAEPLIEDPATAVWDADGRLWVAEMRGYMHSVSGDKENAGFGRIVVLEDDDGDGRMDRSTVFLDGLVMPRAISHVKGGVLIGEPPNIWFCQDTDGDLVCDKKTKVYDGYGQRDAASRTASGLVLTLDNWIYNSRLPVRFQFRKGKLISQPDAYRGDFGVTQDNIGRIYANTNSSWLHADLISPADFLRQPNLLRPTGIYTRIAKDQSVHSIRVNTGVNQGYVQGMLRPDGRLAKTTAATWPSIYRGDNFPDEFIGNAFVPEPAGNVIGRFTLSSSNGIDIEAKHELTPDDDWEQREFLASTDERFRPIQCATGPDGCLYVTDFYRGIIEYKLFVSPFLNEQIVDRKLDQPLGLGRIYRIVHDAKKTQAAPHFSTAKDQELIEALAHPNGWRRDTAQRLLVERSDPALIEPLKKWAANCPEPLGRLHALWTLEGIGAADWSLVINAFQDPDPQMRAAAVRICGSLDAEPAHLRDLLSLAGDSSPAVRLQVLLRLGDFSDHQEARQVMNGLLTPNLKNALFRDATISGLVNNEVAFLSEMPTDSGGGDHGNFVRELTAVLTRDREPESITALLNLAAERSGQVDFQLAILDGIFRGIQKGRPVMLESEPEALSLLRSSKHQQIQNRTKAVEKKITWPEDPTPKTDKRKVRPLTSTERKQFRLGRNFYLETCMPCHQIHGRGMASMAPSLVNSPWVIGSENRLIRIALQGIHGPLTIGKTEWNLVMPGQSSNPRMTDENLAAVLSYIRREWGNGAEPVVPDSIKETRSATKSRLLPWTVEELEKIR